MRSCEVLALSAVTLLVALVTAAPQVENQVDLEEEYSNEVVQGCAMRKRVRRALNIPGRVRPFCMKVVGTVQSAPKVCKSVSEFVVDSTNSACRESCREICTWAIGTTYGCEGIIDKICPNRDTLEEKIRQSVDHSCERTVQRVVNKFGTVASMVDKETVCDQFVEAVRNTCLDSVAEYCGNFREMFQSPCISFLPDIVCK